MDSFSKKAVLLALRKTDIEYREIPDTSLTAITKIEVKKEEKDMTIVIWFCTECGMEFGHRFGFNLMSNGVYDLCTYRKGTIGIFINNYLYFSIRTPSIIYQLIKYFNEHIFDTYKYKCKDVVKLICEKMLRIILKETYHLRQRKYQEITDEFDKEMMDKFGKKYRKELDDIPRSIIFTKDVFDFLEFNSSFEIKINM